MADVTERHGFTREQIEFLQETFARKSVHGFDRPTLISLFGALLVLGLAVSGVLWAEIGSVREELRAEIRENRAAIVELAKGQAELAKGLARIDAILDERLPRDR